jgi:hypothetical protein
VRIKINAPECPLSRFYSDLGLLPWSKTGDFGEKRAKPDSLLAAIQCAVLICREQAPFREFWGVLAWAVPIYLGALWWAVRAPRSERFYEWAVEGMLYLPLLAWWWAT